MAGAPALVVDDDPLVRLLVRQALRHAPEFPQVDEAADLATARGLLRKRRYGCIVLDLGLPDGDGSELVQELAAPTAPAVVVLTGQRERALAVKLVRDGAQDFLDKGEVDLGAILRSVRFAVERRARSSAQERATQAAQELAERDALTGLLNRRGLMARLPEGPREGLFAVMVDADDFKAVNDRHGHDVGDLVLASISKGMKAALRPDGLAARLGGDEFLVVAPVGRPHAALSFAERLKASIDRELRGVAVLRDAGHRVSVSLGVADIGDVGLDLEAVVRRCTAALHGSKDQGKDCVVLAAPGADRAPVPEVDGNVHVEAVAVCHVGAGAAEGFELRVGTSAPGMSLRALLSRARAAGALGAVEARLLALRLDHARLHLLRGRLFLPVTLRALEAPAVIALLEAAGREFGPERLVVWLWGDGVGAGVRWLAAVSQRLEAAGVSLGLGRVGRGETPLEALVALRPRLVRLDPGLVERLGQDDARADEVTRLVRLAQALDAEVLAPDLKCPGQCRAAAVAGIRFATFAEG